MEQTLRVLHVETGSQLLGGPQQVAYLLPALRELGVESTLVCTPGAALGAAMRRQGFLVEEVPCAGDLDLGFIGRLSAVIKPQAPHVVHLHSRRGADVLGAIAARRLGVPVVLSRRVDNPESRLMVRCKYPLYDRVVAISDGIAKVLTAQGLGAEKLQVIRDAVDPRPWQHPASREEFESEFGLPTNALVLGVVAQLIARKGHHVLLEALKDLLGQHSRLMVLCFGKGALQGVLQEQVEAKGWGQRVRFVGFRPDLSRWMAQLHLLVHPALREGLGVSLLQASAAGVPIVASAVGGIPEAVIDNYNGLLVAPGDAAALRDAIAGLLTDTDLHQRLAQAGPRHVAHGFTTAGMAAAHWPIYAALSRRSSSEELTGIPTAYPVGKALQHLNHG